MTAVSLIIFTANERAILVAVASWFYYIWIIFDVDKSNCHLQTSKV